METGLHAHERGGSVPLETSLVEWKPGLPGLLLGLLDPLETSLVEWKRVFSTSLPVWRGILGNFLSGMETPE